MFFSSSDHIAAEKFVTLGVAHYLIMIKTFNHKGLKLLWEKDDSSKLPPRAD
jgi:hypothetical protein